MITPTGTLKGFQYIRKNVAEEEAADEGADHANSEDEDESQPDKMGDDKEPKMPQRLRAAMMIKMPMTMRMPCAMLLIPHYSPSDG